MLLQAADAVVQRATSAVTQASVIEMQWRDFREFSSGERERGAAIDDATRAAGVDRIFARLLPVAWRDFSGSRSLHWEVMLTDDDRPEARAFPSGQIVLAAPFIARFVHSDDELAFLLAHAMAHILLEHGRRGHEAAVPLTRAAGPVDVQAPG
jgi:Zn-dependent protease with chaperone function